MDEKEKVENLEVEDVTENPNKEEGAQQEESKVDNNQLLKEMEKTANEYKDKWMRSVAEFDNYKKRNANLWKEAYSEGMADVILQILPVGDNLDMALSLGLDEKTTEGVKLIRKKFDDILKGVGVIEINPEGEKFDPMIAEAIMQVDGEEGETSENVKQVFQKGYKLKDKIIRYAKVSVIK